MDTLKKALESPATIVAGDSVYKAKPLSIAQLFSVLEKIVVEKHIKTAELITKNMSAKERAAFMMEVWKEIPKLSNVTEQIQDILSDFNSMIYVLSFAISKTEDVKIEEVQEKLLATINQDNVNDYVKVVMEVIGVGEADVEVVEDSKDATAESKKN